MGLKRDWDDALRYNTYKQEPISVVTLIFQCSNFRVIKLIHDNFKSIKRLQMRVKENFGLEMLNSLEIQRHDFHNFDLVQDLT